MKKPRVFNVLSVSLFLFLYAQNAVSAISVEVFMEDQTGSAETNIVKPYIYLQNTGTDTLKNFYWCYYFTVENNEVPVIDKYNIYRCVVTIDSLGSGNYRMKYVFPADSGGVAPGGFIPNNVGGEQLGLHYPDWSTFDRTNDYSYMANATFLENNKIPVFLITHDSLIYGTLPNTIVKPVPKLSGTPTSGQDSLKVQFTDSSTGAVTSRLWNFGDNTTDTTKNPLHDYTKTGSFSVKLVVTGPGGTDSVTRSNYIVITASIPKPVPKLSGTPTSGQDSLKVQFTDSSTGAVTSRLWNFGDNTTDTAKNPLHDYTKTGSFSVKLVVTGPGGTDSITRSNYVVITASIPKPVPKLSGTPTSGQDSLKVQFTDSSTGAVTSRLWNFGDNTTDTAKNPLHDYTKTGSFSVKLVVTGPGGTDSMTRSNYIVITASIPKPVPKLSGTPTSGQDSLKVQFTDSSTGAVTSRLWDFGDNTTDTAKNPLHNYTKTGSFSVKLVVTGPGGTDSVTRLNYIVITASIPKPVPKLSGTPTSGQDSLKVQFTDSSTGAVTSRLWNFGDNTTDTAKNPLHDYTKTGSFSVKLVVTGPGGTDSATIPYYITITSSADTLRPINPIILAAQTQSVSSILLSWNKAAGFDSLRIWKGYNAIPPSTVTPGNGYETIPIALTDTTRLLTGLSPNTSYYFCAQVFGNGLWSLITVKSSAFAKTLDSTDTSSVVNTIQITKILFDSLTNAIKVFWTKDSAQSQNYSIGIYCSAAGYPSDTNGAKQIVPGNRAADSSLIPLGRSILFDTTYYVALWLKKGLGPWSSPIKTTIPTTSYTWQEIVYFSLNNVRDTAYAFNKNIRLYNDISSDPITDTLLAWPPADAANSGFIPVSVGFSFKHGNPSPSFFIGLKCDSIPKKFSAAAVRIYRYDKGAWLVEANSACDPSTDIVSVKTNDLNKPFIAMIDTITPTVANPVPMNPVTAGQAIVDTFIVSDNISNMHCSFHYAKGASAFSEGDSVDTTMASKSNTLILTIPATVVSQDNGVRAFFAYSDGVHTDTINISRQVIRSDKSDLVMTEALQWIPLHVTAMPDSPDVKYALRNFNVKGAWKYDPTVFRLFRWYPCSLNVDTSYKWVEYSDAQKDLFSFIPGTVLWLKSRKQSMIDFGRATTPSLIEPFEIFLQPNGWTDIALPYKFNINIGDILNTTVVEGQSADSLQWYQWSLNANNRYFPDPVYIDGMSESNPDLGNKAFALVSKENIGYGVFNPYNYAVRISIPPIPVSMSSISPKSDNKRARGGWAIKVMARTQEGTTLSPVFCGYARGKEKSGLFFSAPPQLDDIALRVCDARKNLFGHELARGDLKEGGTSFDLAIVNNSGAESAVEYCFETVHSLPTGMQAMLIDPQTGTCESIEKPLVARVAGGERAYRQLAVGGKEYLSKIILAVRLWRLDLLGAFPNPFCRQVRIRYTLPAVGISRVKLSILSISGKTVFETIRPAGSQPGVVEFLWDGTDGRKQHVGAGVYVLRMTAFDKKATAAGTFERKMTYMP